MARTAFAKTNASLLLDLIRGLAALLVLLEHWRNIFFIDYPQVIPHRLMLAPFYALCSAGYQAVIVFFVLSGYLISRSVFKMLDNGLWSWRRYFTHRMVRLWIVLIPGLLLCALWDGIGIHSGLAPILYGGLSHDHVIGHVATHYTLRIFAANMVFLQTIFAKTFGSDAALWSLANEFWYYILFPLGLFAIRPKIGLQLRIACLIAFVGIAWLVGPGILKYFPVWLFGTVLAWMPSPPLLGRTTRRLVGAIYILLFFLLGRKAHMPALVVEYLLAMCTFALVWVCLSATSLSRASMGERLIRKLARFSFTLYVGHIPLCALLAALILGHLRWAPTPLHLLLGFGILILILGYAYGVACVTEFQTERVRDWIETRFHLIPSRALVR